MIQQRYWPWIHHESLEAAAEHAYINGYRLGKWKIPVHPDDSQIQDGDHLGVYVTAFQNVELVAVKCHLTHKSMLTTSETPPMQSWWKSLITGKSGSPNPSWEKVLLKTSSPTPSGATLSRFGSLIGSLKKKD